MCTSTVRSSTSADRPPDKVEQLRPREHPARLLEQIFEQPKIGRPEADFAIPTADAPGEPAQIEVTSRGSVSGAGSQPKTLRPPEGMRLA
jgi:hypothetical protein